MTNIYVFKNREQILTCPNNAVRCKWIMKDPIAIINNNMLKSPTLTGLENGSTELLLIYYDRNNTKKELGYTLHVSDPIQLDLSTTMGKIYVDKAIDVVVDVSGGFGNKKINLFPSDTSLISISETQFSNIFTIGGLSVGSTLIDVIVEDEAKFSVSSQINIFVAESPTMEISNFKNKYTVGQKIFFEYSLNGGYPPLNLSILEYDKNKFFIENNEITTIGTGIGEIKYQLVDNNSYYNEYIYQFNIENEIDIRLNEDIKMEIGNFRQLIPVISGGYPPYKLTWNYEGNCLVFDNALSTTPKLYGIKPGNYKISAIVIDNQDNKIEKFFDIIVLNKFRIHIDDVKSYPNVITEIKPNIVGGMPPYEIYYSFYDTSLIDIVSLANDKIDIITDTNHENRLLVFGHDSSGNICAVNSNVIYKDQPNVSIDGNNIIHIGKKRLYEAEIIGGHPPYSYEWSIGSGLHVRMVGSGKNQKRTNVFELEGETVSSGEIMVKIIDSNGYSATSCLSVDVVQEISVTPIESCEINTIKRNTNDSIKYKITNCMFPLTYKWECDKPDPSISITSMEEDIISINIYSEKAEPIEITLHICDSENNSRSIKIPVNIVDDINVKFIDYYNRMVIGTIQEIITLTLDGVSPYNYFWETDNDDVLAIHTNNSSKPIIVATSEGETNLKVTITDTIGSTCSSSIPIKVFGYGNDALETIPHNPVTTINKSVDLFANINGILNPVVGGLHNELADRSDLIEYDYTWTLISDYGEIITNGHHAQFKTDRMGIYKIGVMASINRPINIIDEGEMKYKYIKENFNKIIEINVIDDMEISFVISEKEYRSGSVHINNSDNIRTSVALKTSGLSNGKYRYQVIINSEIKKAGIVLVEDGHGYIPPFYCNVGKESETIFELFDTDKVIGQATLLTKKK